MASNATLRTSKYQRIQPFVICSLASFFYVYEFFLRVIPGAMPHELMRHYALTARGLGVIAALFFYGYTPMQIPAGLLLDNFGVRKLMTTAMFLCAFSTFLFATTRSPVIAGVSRLMIGFCSSFAYVGTLVLASRWFKAKYFALIAGLVQFMGCMGAIIGLAPVAALSQTIGWHHTIILAGYAGIILGVLFWLILRDYPPHTANKFHLQHNGQAEFNRLRTILHKPHTWIVGAYGFSTWAPVSIFAALWGVPTLMVMYGITSTKAAGAISIFWLGIAIFSPLVGWWSDFIGKRRSPLITCSIVGVICSLLILYTPGGLNWMLLYVVLFIYGVSAAAQALSFGVIQDFTPPMMAGTAVGFNNMAVVVGGILLQPLVGFILHGLWSGKMLNGIHFYSLQDYRIALIVLPLSSLVGLITSVFFIKETYCQPQYELAMENDFD